MSLPWMFAGVRGASVHHEFYNFPHIDFEVVQWTPVHQVLDLSSVRPVVPIHNEANDGKVRELFHKCVTLPSFRLRLSRCSTIPQSSSMQDFRSLKLIPVGCAAFFVLIPWCWFLRTGWSSGVMCWKVWMKGLGISVGISVIRGVGDIQSNYCGV